MPDFGCYMFNVEGEILFGVNIAAENLDAALQRVFELRHTKNKNRPPSRLIHAVEVWSGSNRLFPAPTDAWVANRRVAQPIDQPCPVMPLPYDFARSKGRLVTAT